MGGKSNGILAEDISDDQHIFQSIAIWLQGGEINRHDIIRLHGQQMDHEACSSWATGLCHLTTSTLLTPVSHVRQHGWPVAPLLHKL